MINILCNPLLATAILFKMFHTYKIRYFKSMYFYWPSQIVDGRRVYHWNARALVFSGRTCEYYYIVPLYIHILEQLLMMHVLPVIDVEGTLKNSLDRCDFLFITSKTQVDPDVFDFVNNFWRTDIVGRWSCL